MVVSLLLQFAEAAAAVMVAASPRLLLLLRPHSPSSPFAAMGMAAAPPAPIAAAQVVAPLSLQHTSMN